jgi:hypothetical protein
LVASAVTAFVTIRGFEGAIPLLALAPVALLGGGEGDRRRRWWLVAWAAVLSVAVALAVWPVIASRPEAAYQTSILTLDLAPRAVIGRLLRQFEYALLPLLTTSPRNLSALAVLTAGAFAVIHALERRDLRAVTDSRRAQTSLAIAALAGLAAATLAYAPFAFSPQVKGPLRTHFFAAPGLGLLLASLIGLAARLPSRRLEPVLSGLAGAWIVALGTTHVAAMQRYWDRFNPFWAQAQTLSELIRQAPGLKPHTLVVLLDETGSWVSTFSFRHAVQYVYGQEVLGYVPGTSDLFYPTRIGRDGVRCEPWPVIRGPWRSPPTLHGFDEVVVLRRERSGVVAILKEWPAEALAPLPAGARYEPRGRILAEAPPLRSRAVLARASTAPLRQAPFHPSVQ